MLAWVDRTLVWAFDLGLSPLLALPPLAGLLVVSLATAVVMLLVVARTSNQAGIIAAKRGIHAALFEIRLYGDDLGLVARASATSCGRTAATLASRWCPWPGCSSP